MIPDHKKVEACNALCVPFKLVEYQTILVMLQSLSRTPHNLRPLVLSFCSNISTLSRLSNITSRFLPTLKKSPLVKPQPIKPTFMPYSKIQELYSDSRKAEYFVAKTSAEAFTKYLKNDVNAGCMHLWDYYRVPLRLNGAQLIIGKAAMKPYLETMSEFLPKDLLKTSEGYVNLYTSECKVKATSPSGSLLSIGELIWDYDKSEVIGNQVMHKHARLVVNWVDSVLQERRKKGVLHLSSATNSTINFPFELSNIAIKEFKRVLDEYYEPDFTTVEKIKNDDYKVNVIIHLDRVPITRP